MTDRTTRDVLLTFNGDIIGVSERHCLGDLDVVFQQNGLTVILLSLEEMTVSIDMAVHYSPLVTDDNDDRSVVINGQLTVQSSSMVS